MIQIKNAKELDGMRRANALSAAALKYGLFFYCNRDYFFPILEA